MRHIEIVRPVSTLTGRLKHNVRRLMTKLYTYLTQEERNRSNDDVIDAAYPDRLLKDSQRTSLSRRAASAQQPGWLDAG